MRDLAIARLRFSSRTHVRSLGPHWSSLELWAFTEINLTASETDPTLRNRGHFVHFVHLFNLFTLNSALSQSVPAYSSLILSASVSFQYSVVLIMSNRSKQWALRKSSRLARGNHSRPWGCALGRRPRLPHTPHSPRSICSSRWRGRWSSRVKLEASGQSKCDCKGSRGAPWDSMSKSKGRQLHSASSQNSSSRDPPWSTSLPSILLHPLGRRNRGRRGEYWCRVSCVAWRRIWSRWQCRVIKCTPRSSKCFSMFSPPPTFWRHRSRKKSAKWPAERGRETS